MLRENIPLTNVMASGPETRIIPIAPPAEVDGAHIVVMDIGLERL